MKRFRGAALRPALAIALALGLLAPFAASAQDSSPSPTDGVIRSPTRQEIHAELQAAFAETDEPAQNTEGVYVTGVTSDLQSVNPYLVESSPSLDVVGLVYEGLYNSDPRTGEPIPTALADYWEISPDRLTYTFYLNKDARWHDGVDVTAEDVAFSLEALSNPATGSAYTGAFNEAVDSWQVIDQDTIQIVAKEPRFTFLYDIQGLFIVPKHIWENVPFEEWATDPGSTGQDPARIIGTGPYRFNSWLQGQEISLVRNEDYYEHKPNFREYLIRIYPDAEAQFNAFLNGDIDAIGLEPEQVQVVENTDGLSWQSWPERGFVYYEFNLDPSVPLFQDKRVRQAFMWALDRESIVNDIMRGFGEVATGTHPEISPGYAPDRMTTKYTYDPERAKQLLAEAGWTDTNGNGTVDKDGQEMSFEFLYASGSPTNDTLVAYLQDAWRQVGIDMQPRALDLPTLIESTTSNNEWRMAMYGFGWDATFIQDVMFGCDQTPPVGFNDMKYCNPELDEIHDQAKREFDEEKRRELLIQASDIVNEEQPVGIITFSVAIGAYNDRVHNYHESAWGNQSYVGLWVEE
ncbi:MAG TPA: ABC transporter substrate-binding protein [Thermomicrobiales bacterium]